MSESSNPSPDSFATRLPKLSTETAGDADATNVTPGTKPAWLGEDQIADEPSTIDEFTILRKLGQGGFASVYLARQETMQRLVALKLGRGGGDESIVLARLDHPNIVRVYDQRRRTSPPTDLIYMEYLPAGTLADLITTLQSSARQSLSGRDLLAGIDRRLVEVEQVPPVGSPTRRWLESAAWSSTVAWIGYQLAQALDEAHRRSVTHRDVKPANVLLTAEGVPKLADFNVSVAAGPGSSNAEANFGGSLPYMSPEQLRAMTPDDAMRPSDLDGRSDLYSLGLVLWELWQGSRPWASETHSRSLRSAVNEELNQRANSPPVIDAMDATGRALQRILYRVLKADRECRPATGAELAGHLRLALHPDAAPMFHPLPGGLRARLLRLPFWLVSVAILLVPNIAAGVFNYLYNELNILGVYPEMRAVFQPLATSVNAIAYPLGAASFFYFTGPIAKGLSAARQGRPVSEASIETAWQLGSWAAKIGGTLWVIAGLIYPIVLKLCYPQFPWTEAFHFFISLVICGGVAWTVPFFMGQAAGVLLYYPTLVAGTMRDERFPLRMEDLRRRGGRYLIMATMIPLLAASLATNRTVLTITLVATALGLLFSFIAYQKFEDAFNRLSVALASQETTPSSSIATHPPTPHRTR